MEEEKKDKSHKHIKVRVENPLSKEDRDKKIEKINELIKTIYGE